MIWTETDILNQMIAAERARERAEKKKNRGTHRGIVVLAAIQ